MRSRYLIPRQGGGFVAPEFEAPTWDKSKITGYAQAAAAPGIRQLRRGLQTAIPRGYTPWDVQGRRAAIEGYGGGLSQVMGGARATGAAQYGQEYGREFEAAKIGYGGRLQKAQADWQAGQARTQREWQEEQWGRERQEREDIREDQMWGGTPPGGVVPGGGGGGLIRRPEKMKQRSFAPWEMPNRAKGGPVHSSVQAPVYEVGEEGPELYVPDRGQPQVVGTQGPEARTFSQEGEIIPASETQEIMNRQMQISYDPLPPLSKKEQAIFDAAIGEEGFEATSENRENMLIKRQRGGRVQRQESPLQQNIMNYLSATRFSPSGAGHMPYWQFMLQAQPQKLAGLLAYLQGGKPDFGSGRVSTGPARKKSTRKGFVPEKSGAGGFERPIAPTNRSPGISGFTI